MKNALKTERTVIKQKIEDNAKIVLDEKSSDDNFIGALKNLCTLNVLDK